MAHEAPFYAESGPSFLPMLGQLLWILQIALIIHVYRTGRPYWWTWVLLMAPGIGGLAYVIVELLPGYRSPTGFWHSLKPQKWRIADKREQLEESETVDNRLSLAEELFEAGEFAEADAIASECLKGVFQNDPRTLVDVAKYKIALGKHEEAYAFLSRVDTTRNRMLALEHQVMRGDCLAALGKYAEAEEAYQSVIGFFIGEAPRVGLAQIYEKTGRADEAIALWKDIQKKFRRSSPAWRRTERSWYKLAKTKLEKKAA